MRKTRHGNLCQIWPRIYSKYFTENCVTYDHGYVPSTLRKIVSHMTTDMFQARYANLCHKWPRICSVFHIHSGIRVAQSLVFCVVLYGSLFVLLSFFIWPLHCLSFYGFWIILWYLPAFHTWSHRFCKEGRFTHCFCKRGDAHIVSVKRGDSGP